MNIQYPVSNLMKVKVIMRMDSFDLEIKPVHEKVYDLLKNAILDGAIRPGERLLQNELAAKFGVSRMPIRDALRLLEADRLVVIIQNKGATVIEFSQKDLEDIFFVRSMIEREAVKLAAPHITEADINVLESLLVEMDKCIAVENFHTLTKLNYEFHHTIYERTLSPLLIKMINNLWYQFPRYAMLTSKETSLRSQKTHYAIVNSLKNGNGEAAGAYMEQNIMFAANTLLKGNEERFKKMIEY